MPMPDDKHTHESVVYILAGVYLIGVTDFLIVPNPEPLKPLQSMKASRRYTNLSPLQNSSLLSIPSSP